MKIAVITDTHWGARSDSLVFLDYTKKFVDEVFFPYLDEHNIKVVAHLGDLVERRKYINIYTAYRLRTDFLEPLATRNLDVVIIAGNHDVYYKETNEINALREVVEYNYGFKVFTEPTEIDVDGIKVLLVPWINNENRERSYEAIKNTKAQICFGHLQLTSFEMYRGHKITEGDDPTLFQKFDVVLTGHYHHKSSSGNIHYLGSIIQSDWGDFDDPRGFHIFDTDTRELTFIENPFVVFKKIFYDDKDKLMDAVIGIEGWEQYKDCYVKVVVQNKTNPYWFDMFIEELEKHGPVDIQIVEDHHNLHQIDEEEVVSEAEDTLSIFHKFIDQIEEGSVDKTSLKKQITDLYVEAMELG